MTLGTQARYPLGTRTDTRLRSSAAALAAAAAVWYLFSFRGPALTFDDGDYFLLARSLLAGKGYLLERSAGLMRPHWPPGFPLLLSAMLKVGGETTWAVAAPSFAASVALVPVLFGLFGGDGRALAIAAAAAFNPFAVVYATQAMSEPVFVLLVYGSLLASRRGRLPLAVALAAASIWMRPVGVAVVAALAAEAGAEARDWRRALAVVAVSAALVAPVALFSRLGGYKEEYAGVPWTVGAFLGCAIEDAAVHVGKYPLEFASSFLAAGFARSGSPLWWFVLKTALSTAVSAAAAWGFWRSSRERLTSLELFAGFYTAILLTSPTYRFEYRFFWPLYPAFLWYFVLGAESLGRRLRRTGPAALGAVLAAAVAASAGENLRPEAYRTLLFRHYDAAAEADVRQACDWLRARARPGDVLYADWVRPAAFRLYGGVDARPMSGDADAMLAKGRWFVLDRSCCEERFRDIWAPRLAGLDRAWASADGRLEIYRGKEREDAP